jgi:hypothetical protein
MSRRNVAALIALVLGGCSLIVDPSFRQVTNHCAAPMDCTGGAHCDATTSMCVQPPALPYELWLEVAPPNATTGTIVMPIDLGPYDRFSGPIALVVPPLASVRGTVRHDNAPVAAELTFTTVSTGPLGTHSVSTRTTSSSPDVDFMISVPSRSTYEVVVTPVGDSLSTVAPFHTQLMVGASDVAFGIPLPPTAVLTSTHVIGELVDTSGGPLGDFEVLAVDRATGALVSSVSPTTTPTTTGDFDLVLGSTAPFDIVVRPTAARSANGPVPTYQVRPEVLLPDASGHVRILVPASMPAVHWAGTVELPEIRGVYPVAGAVMQLHSSNVVDNTTGIVGSLDLTLTTDANGLYDGYVLPGTYTIVITPTADANQDLGVLRETRDLHPPIGAASILGQVFHLPLRTILSGSVQSPDGDLVPGAHVHATALGLPLVGVADPDLARFARSADALSDAMGHFRVSLDVGVYDVVVEPPDGSGFAWTLQVGYGIGGSATTPPAVMQVDAPVIVDADVSWIDGGMLVGAEVRAFGITADHRAVMVGRATSDAHGRARVLVPATLGH